MKYIPYVNVKMGTRSHMRYSTGNTLPLTQMPFGMASFCPQTEVIEGREGWFFNPELPSVEGIRLTHQPSPWIRDYGTVLMTPQNDIISDTSDGAWSGYRIKDSILRPDYIKIKFLRQDCVFELAPTERGCAFSLSFENDKKSYLSFLPVMGNYTYKFDRATSTLIGTNDGHSQDEAKDFKMYFAVRFLDGCLDIDSSYKVEKDGKTSMHVAVKSKKAEGRVAISYISEEMALDTLERESGSLSFEEIRQRAEDEWEEKLHRIEVKSDNEKLLKAFYTCMYRAFLFPLGIFLIHP